MALLRQSLVAAWHGKRRAQLADLSAGRLGFCFSACACADAGAFVSVAAPIFAMGRATVCSRARSPISVQKAERAKARKKIEKAL